MGAVGQLKARLRGCVRKGEGEGEAEGRGRKRAVGSLGPWEGLGRTLDVTRGPRKVLAGVGRSSAII